VISPEQSPQEENTGHNAYTAATGPVAVQMPAYRWYHKLSAVLLVVFCFEIGLFLIIFPWTPFWGTNYFGSLIPQWHDLWDNLYLRGAVSGLGAVNIYIALLELYRLRRFARR
jgi:hypothetical protein